MMNTSNPAEHIEIKFNRRFLPSAFFWCVASLIVSYVLLSISLQFPDPVLMAFGVTFALTVGVCSIVMRTALATQLLQRKPALILTRNSIEMFQFRGRVEVFWSEIRDISMYPDQQIILLLLYPRSHWLATITSSIWWWNVYAINVAELDANYQDLVDLLSSAINQNPV